MRVLANVIGLALAVSLFGVGCTHTQLRHNTVKQSETVSDLFQQQVLDNLAMFAYDSDSLPVFAFPNEGTNQVTDTGGATVGLDWLAAGFDKIGLGVGAERKMQEAWTMEPIRDPHKLMLMRCAYQHAVATCLGEEVVSDSCPKCCEILKAFYTDEAHEHGVNETCVATWKEDCGWFGAGSKKDVPKDCGCVLVGHYCDQYVWVLPGNRDKLTQLTLAILDFAIYEPPEPKLKEVVVEKDKDGNVTKRTETYSEAIEGKYRRRARTEQGFPSLRQHLMRLQIRE